MSEHHKNSTATDRLQNEMHGAVDIMRTELTRVEILAAGLAAFSQPVPDYEPRFHHLRHLTVRASYL